MYNYVIVVKHIFKSDYWTHGTSGIACSLTNEYNSYFISHIDFLIILLVFGRF